MQRVLEPEVMDGDAQSAAYANADFESSDRAIVARFRTLFPTLDRGHFLDMGCGPAAIARYLCEALPEISITGVDASAPMIEWGRKATIEAGLEGRIRLVEGYFPGALEDKVWFDAVISNSLLHHLPDPSVLWSEIKRLTLPGASVFVVDLMRPASTDIARGIVEAYAPDEPEVLKEDFFVSLCAAFTPEEIIEQLNEAGLSSLRVEIISDRHLAIYGTVS